MSTEVFCVIVAVGTLAASSSWALAVSCYVLANMTPSTRPLQIIRNKIETVLLRGEFRPRQTRQLPRAADLKGRLLS